MSLSARNHMLLLLLVCLGGVLLTGCGKENSKTEKQKAQSGSPVEIVEVAQKNIKETIEAVGTLDAAEEVTIRPEVSALVESIHFESGQRVTIGQKLFSLDDDQVFRRMAVRRAALDSTQVRMRNARRIYERRKELLEQNVGTREVMEEARTQYRYLAAEANRIRAEIEELEEELENYRIDSPMDAFIGDSLVDVGDYVETGDDLVVLVKTNPLELTFHVPERHAPQVEVGQTVQVVSAAAPGKTFSGEVFFISPRVRETTRDLQIKALLVNPENTTLRPGGFANVSLSVRTLRDVMVIPEESLVPIRSGYMVFVIEDGLARSRDVKIGLRLPGQVQILEGLSPGQKVVRSGHISISDGSPVKIVNPS